MGKLKDHDAEMCYRNKVLSKLLDGPATARDVSIRIDVINYIYKGGKLYPTVWNYFKSTDKRSIVVLELLRVNGLEWCYKELELTYKDKTLMMAEVLGAK